MAPRTKNRFWRLCGIYFRRFRITLWLVILAFLGALLYLNQIGLPGFVKRPLQEKLRARGLDVEFSRLRWRFDRGLVAENVRFGSAEEPSSPSLAVKEAQLQLDYKALVKLRFQVVALVLRQGQLIVPVPETTGPPRQLSVDQIQTELRLLPGDLWQLDHFQAQFAGARIQLAGVITNASAVREWKLVNAGRPAAPGTWERRLRQLADTLQQIQFSSPPQLSVDVKGDARDLQSFAVRLALNAPDAATPWGTFQNGSFSLLLHPASSNTLSHAEVSLQADGAQTHWANTANLTLSLHLLSSEADTNMVQARLDVAGTGIETKWGRANRAHFAALWFHSITNAIPISGHGELDADEPSTRWGSARQLHLASNLLPPTNAPVAGDPAWGAWTNLVPFALDWECQASELKSPTVEVAEFSSAGEWRAPALTVNRITTVLYGGKLDARADLDVATREFKFSGTSDFDALKISPLLSEKGRQWLAQFSWKRPPLVKAEGQLILPAWTNLANADWRGGVRPTVIVDGTFRIGDGAYRGVAFNSAESHFSYSNLRWELPDLVAIRPEGRLYLFHEADELTRDFYCRFGSTINVRALRPLLQPGAQRELDNLGLTQPPVIDGEVWGRWREPERIGIKARVALTNFTVRGETAGDFQTTLEFTNQLLKLIEPRLHRGAKQQLSASIVNVDFVAKKIYLTNGFSTAEPLVVARAIGTNVGRTLEPYRFLQPPTVRAEGVIPIRKETDADLHFNVDGGPFEWWKFKLPRIIGKVDWTGQQLALRDVQAQFYQGNATGDATFDFSKGGGSDFNFNMVAADADLHLLMNDLSQRPTKLEGLLTARLAIARARTSDWQSWQGRGRVSLRDGLIWEIPIFGIFSPALDSIATGLGSARASEGSGTFDIVNGVVRSNDLEIKASTMRLRYSGTVTLAGDVNGRAQAELLRDTWVIGPILSLALWPVSKIFEYEISGTLQEPRGEPVFFVPKILLSPFHPSRTGKDSIPDGPGSIMMAPPPIVP